MRSYRFNKYRGNDCIKIIDYDRIETGVQLRCRKPGDFLTFGKEHKKNP